MAGGDCIDGAPMCCAPVGRPAPWAARSRRHPPWARFLRSFQWGHVRQLDRVCRELLARAWAAGAGPGDAPFTIDLDSTICETYGLAKDGARHHGYTGKRGYHPLLAIAAGTGDVLMSRLREGRANTARGAAHFLRETVGRVRYAGANGRLTSTGRQRVLRLIGVVSVCRKMDVRFSITIRQHQEPAQSRARGDTRGCLDSHSLLDGRRRRCGRDHLHSLHRVNLTPHRRGSSSRRVKPTPGSQLALFGHLRAITASSPTGTGRWLELEAGPSPPSPRSRMPSETSSTVWMVEPSPLGPLRRQRRLAGGTGDGPRTSPAGQRASVWASRW